MVENIFKKGYAECMIARTNTSDGSKGEAIGLALVSRHLTSWISLPSLRHDEEVLSIEMKGSTTELPFTLSTSSPTRPGSDLPVST
jgi:hypothetical protein